MTSFRKIIILGMSIAVTATNALASDQYAQVLKNRVSGMGLDPSPIDCMTQGEMVQLNEALRGGNLKAADRRSTAKFQLSQAKKKC